jgi:hypothetical protein
VFAGEQGMDARSGAEVDGAPPGDALDQASEDVALAPEPHDLVDTTVLDGAIGGEVLAVAGKETQLGVDQKARGFNELHLKRIVDEGRGQMGEEAIGRDFAAVDEELDERIDDVGFLGCPAAAHQGPEVDAETAEDAEAFGAVVNVVAGLPQCA